MARQLKYISGLLIIVILAGCASHPLDQYKDDNWVSYGQAVVSGAIIGCGGGAIIKLIDNIDKKKSDKTEGMLEDCGYGAGAGAAGAVILNAILQDKRAKDAWSKEETETAYEFLSQENDKLENYIALARNTLKQDASKFIKIKSDYDNGLIEKEAAEKKLSQLIENKEILENNLININKRKEKTKELAKLNPDLEPEFKQLQDRVETLKEMIQETLDYEISPPI